jgi:hypothetical protein
MSSNDEQAVEISDIPETHFPLIGKGSTFAKVVAVKGKNEGPFSTKGDEAFDATNAIVNSK